MVKFKRDVVAVVLAAGKGTRMRSSLAKMVHDLCGKPIVRYGVDAARACGVERIIVVVGHAAEQVKAALGDDFEYVYQEQQLGTGHALKQAVPLLEGFEGDLLVFHGDSPFLTADILRDLIRHHQKTKAAATILTAVLPDPGNYGRIVRGIDGRVIKIVERKDASLAELRINEVNSGTYCFDAAKTLPLLDELDTNNVQREYYLTDIIGIMFGRNMRVETITASDPYVVLGVNDRRELAQALKVFRERILENLMRSGVTIVDPESTYIDSTVKVGQDTVIYPFSFIERGTVIGKNCVIGPHVKLSGAKIGNNVSVQFSVIVDTQIKSNTDIEPYSYIVNGEEKNRKG